MQFELTKALIDDILFSMEDQDGEFFFDTLEGVVIGGMDRPVIPDNDENDEDQRERYINLPEWDSACGFRLMERFVAGFRNPLIRGDLTAALGHGKGVFRAFKNTLGRYPEAEKYWFAFKEQEMKREVIRWYNGLREEWGLKKIGTEPEETGDLVHEDFRFRPSSREDMAKAEELHRFCQNEHKNSIAGSWGANSAGILLKESQFMMNGLEMCFSHFPDLPSVTGFTAESSGGEFAGYILGTIKDSVLHIYTIEVKAEYRGMGIGETLLQKLIDSMDTNEVIQVLLDVPSWAEEFSRVLLRESFRPYTIRYWLNLQDRMN